MKQDSQHLEFLISQYVDDVLDAPNRKFVEQQLAADPAARDLLKQHREAQDLLDDYGSRLPLIDWNDFDATLAARLDAENASPTAVAPWRRWMRPVAAAAALLIAATGGYAWHAYSRTDVQSPIAVSGPRPIAPESHVTLADRPQPRGSIVRVNVDETPATQPPHETVAVDFPNGDAPTHDAAPKLPGAATAGIATQPDSRTAGNGIVPIDAH